MHNSTGFNMYHWLRPNSILLIVGLVRWFIIYIPKISPSAHVFKQLFFFCVVLLPQFFLCMWIPFRLISPSALFWIFALLLVEKSIMLDCTTVSVYNVLLVLLLYSASIPGGHSSSHGIPSVHYSFEHNSIPSPTYYELFSYSPIEGHSFIFQFLSPQRVQL